MIEHDGAAPCWLSQSPIWPMQRRYFERVGVGAWRDAVVPSFITANAFIARAYAEIALAYGDDMACEAPLLIVELGAGSGRFAHFLLQRLFGGPERRRIRYVMTDISRANIAFWRAHEKFAPFVAQGALDFACFNPVTDRALRLEISGETLSAETVAGPVMAIANYVFDGVEQDLFEMVGGRLHACLVSLSGAPSDDGGLDGVEVAYHARPCPPAPYASAAWNEALALYAQEFRDGAFLFPTGAARAIENLRRIARDRLLVLAADKGPNRLEDVPGAQRPKLVRHGSVSLGVNFHALAELTRRACGETLETPHRHGRLNIVGLAHGAGAGLTATRRAYAQAIVCRGPDDLYLMKKAMEKAYAELTLAEAVAFLRTMEWDPSVVLGMYDRLVTLLGQTPARDHGPLREGLRLAWERYLPLGEATDLAFALGNLAAATGDYEAALGCFAASRASHGDNEATEANIRLCRSLAQSRT